MTRLLAWKPRSAVIMPVNWVARSTLDISSAPVVTVPRPPVPAVPMLAAPEAEVAEKLFWPARRRPAELRKLARAIWPRTWVWPLRVDAGQCAGVADGEGGQRAGGEAVGLAGRLAACR